MPKLIVTDPARPTATPRVAPDALGAGVGRAVSQLGAQVNRTAQIAAAAGEQRASVLASQYSVALQDAEREILSDPSNLNEREKLLERAQKRLRTKYRGGITQRFDQQAKLAEDVVGSRLRHRTRLDQIARGNADLSDNLDLLADDWARSAGDAEAQSLIEARALRQVNAAVESGLTDGNVARDLENRFRKRRALGVITRLMREDPLQAQVVLGSPIQGMDEVQRQDLLTRASAAHAAEMRSRRSMLDAQAKELEQAEKEQAEQAELRLVELDATGMLTVADVLALPDIVPSERQRLWLDRAKEGGGPATSATMDRNLYERLKERAEAGDPTVEADIISAHREQRIPLSVRRELVEDDQRSRFGDARSMMLRALDVGEEVFGNNSSAAMAYATRAHKAEMEFDRWVKANPDASREDAMSVAQRAAQSAQFADMGTNPAFNLESPFADRNAFDFDAAAEKIDAAVAAGTLTEAAADFEFVILERQRDLLQAGGN